MVGPWVLAPAMALTLATGPGPGPGPGHSLRPPVFGPKLELILARVRWPEGVAGPRSSGIGPGPRRARGRARRSAGKVRLG